MEYRVTWVVDVDAPDPVSAARKARALAQPWDSSATVYGVQPWTNGQPAGESTEVDLWDNPGPVDFPRGDDGTCAFCKGDPCAERSPINSAIGAYFARNKWAETCPTCKGQPS